MGAETIFGSVDNSKVASNFYMSADGTITTNNEDGEVFKWDLSDNEVIDDKGKKTSFGDFLGSLGSSVNSFLDVVNKTAQTYENATGSKIIGSSSQSSGQLTTNDLNTLSSVVNSSINQLKKNALYVGVGITAIVLGAMLVKKKK